MTKYKDKYLIVVNNCIVRECDSLSTAMRIVSKNDYDVKVLKEVYKRENKEGKERI